MSVEAFVGLVGGGKSYNSVRRMMAYMARGGRVCSNILLTGYNQDSKDFVEDSPVLPFLRSIGWNYQKGQYTYIPFDEMVRNPFWIQQVPAGVDRDHRTLLVVDEATDLFDSLDGGRLRSDSAYREIFHFLRLSRHCHTDVLFIAQDIAAINTRLKGLVAFIWRSTDMKKFRLPKLRIPFPFDLFMLQQFDKSGKYEVKREWVKKDPRVFTLYESEAFNNSLSVKWDGVSISMDQGQIKEGRKKMTKLQLLLLFLALGMSGVALFQMSSIKSLGGGGGVVTNYVYNTASATSSSSDAFKQSSNSVVVVRGAFKYYEKSTSDPAYVVFKSAKLVAGQPCEWGYITHLSRDMVSGSTFDGDLFYLLPEYSPPPINENPISIKHYRLVKRKRQPRPAVHFTPDAVVAPPLD